MKRILLALLLSTVFFSASTASVSAASLTFGGSRSVSVGENISIPVFISTSGSESANAVAATVNFPADKLRVVSVSESGIVDLWAEKPAYSNTRGTVTFQGVTYNPGYSGTNGRVISITFRALREGDAILSFSDRSILANDGEGTEILTGSGSATIQILAAVPAAPRESAEAVVAPAQQDPEEIIIATDTPRMVEEPVVVAEPRGEYVVNLSIPYGFLVDMSEIMAALLPFLLVFLGLAGWVVFGLWLGWNRLHRVRRNLLNRLAATDTDLHAELLELHNALEDEVMRLRAKEADATLTSEERHILARFNTMLDNMTEVKMWHLKPRSQKRGATRRG